MTENELHWVAGLLEGEGCFSMTGRSACVVCKMNDRDVIERLHKLMGIGRVYTHTYTNKRYGEQMAWMWKVARREEVVEVMNRLRPLMGQRRGSRIDEILGKLADLPAPTSAGRPRDPAYDVY